jgi:hypothetical protein
MDISERLVGGFRRALDADRIGDVASDAAHVGRKIVQAFAASISASITFMPAWAKAVPSASPIPLAPPVTNAVLPASSRIVDCPRYLQIT